MASILNFLVRLRSPSGLVLMGRGLQFGSQLALMLLVPKLLSPLDFVEYSLITPLGFLLGSIFFGWITSPICRYAFEFLSPEGAPQRQATAGFFFLVGLLSLGVFWLLHSYFHTGYAVVALVLFSSSVRAAVLGVLNASREASAFLKANLWYLLPPGGFLVACAYPQVLEFRQALLLFIGLEALVGMAIVVWGKLRFWEVRHIDWRVLRPYLLFGAPLVLNAVANWLLSISDRYFLSIWVDTQHTADYILSYQLAGSIIAYPMSFYLAVFVPRALLIEQRHGLPAALHFVSRSRAKFLPWVPLFWVLSAGTVVGIKYFFYRDYALDIGVVVLISLAHLVHAVGHFYFKDLELTGRTLSTTLAIGAGALVNVLCNLLLIPRFGTLGAAVATLLGYLVFTAVMRAARRAPPAGAAA